MTPKDQTSIDTVRVISQLKSEFESGRKFQPLPDDERMHGWDGFRERWELYQDSIEWNALVVIPKDADERQALIEESRNKITQAEEEFSAFRMPSFAMAIANPKELQRNLDILMGAVAIAVTAKKKLELTKAEIRKDNPSLLRRLWGKVFR